MTVDELKKKLCKNKVDEEESFTLGYRFGYTDLITAEGGKVVVAHDIGEWQGSTLVLLEKDGKFGYLSFGWGSCGGCDALQGCESWDSLAELQQHLSNQTKWFDTSEEAARFMVEHDWEGDYTGSDEGKQFAEKALNVICG